MGILETEERHSGCNLGVLLLESSMIANGNGIGEGKTLAEQEADSGNAVLGNPKVMDMTENITETTTMENGTEEATTEPAIAFHHVTKKYKLYKNDKQRFKAIFFKNVPCSEKKAINDVSFEIHPGESVALFGRNGAGKSTLLKMITQVTYPTMGEVEVNGRVSALLELTAGFDPEFTGRENIYFRGTLLGLKEADVKALEPAIVKFAALGEYMDQPVRTYSSGMKARLGFAINVNIHPEILIVDEALSVGDKSFRRKCKRKIRKLVDQENITFLFVTHSTASAEAFCKRGLVMKKGALVFDGDIQDASQFYEDMIAKEDAELAERRRKKREARLAAKKAKEEAKAKAEAAAMATLEENNAPDEGTEKSAEKAVTIGNEQEPREEQTIDQ